MNMHFPKAAIVAVPEFREMVLLRDFLVNNGLDYTDPGHWNEYQENTCVDIRFDIDSTCYCSRDWYEREWDRSYPDWPVEHPWRFCSVNDFIAMCTDGVDAILDAPEFDAASSDEIASFCVSNG